MAADTLEALRRVGLAKADASDQSAGRAALGSWRLIRRRSYRGLGFPLYGCLGAQLLSGKSLQFSLKIKEV